MIKITINSKVVREAIEKNTLPQVKATFFEDKAGAQTDEPSKAVCCCFVGAVGLQLGLTHVRDFCTLGDALGQVMVGDGNSDIYDVNDLDEWSFDEIKDECFPTWNEEEMEISIQ